MLDYDSELDGFIGKGIVIDENGTLTLEEDTVLFLEGMPDLDGFHFSVEGTLCLLTSGGTKLFGLADGTPKDTTLLYLNGGTIEVTQGTTDDELVLDKMNIVLGSEDAAIAVDYGLTFTSGSIVKKEGGGSITKTGEGTYRVGNVTLGTETISVLDGKMEFLGTLALGTLNVGDLDNSTSGMVEITKGGTIGEMNVESGTVKIFEATTIGVLNLQAGTTLNGLQNGGERTNLLIKDGATSTQNGITGTWSTIEGDLENIGYLGVGNDSATRLDTLTFEGGTHTMEGIVVYKNAVVDIKGNTTIELISDDSEETTNDIWVKGKLKISTTAGPVFSLADLSTGDPVPVTITLAGGTLEIYQEVGETDTDIISDHNTRIMGAARIIVESGLTYQSGPIDWLKTSATDTGESARLDIFGGGTFQTGKVDMGEGILVIGQVSGNDFLGDNTVIDFLDTVTAGMLYSAEDTTINTYDAATFGMVNIAGDYFGNGNDLILTTGGQVTGHVSGVGILTLEGGTLWLGTDPAAPTISVEQWKISDVNNTYIRLLGNTAGHYSFADVIEIIDTQGDDMDKLLGVLNRSTALYKPVWTADSAGTLSVTLDILGVGDYIQNHWGQHGKSIEMVGNIFSEFSNNDNFRRGLESLSDSQLQTVLRNALAGELTGNAYRIAMQQPASTVFRHLDGVHPLRSPFTRRTIRGQNREGFNVWFNPYGQTEKGDGDGNSFDGYEMTQAGFYLGGDIEIYRRAVVGTIFGFSSPTVKSDIGKVTAKDYTAGLYLRTPIAWEVLLNAIIGFGSQDYQYNNSFRRSDFGGNSFFTSIELLRPISFRDIRLNSDCRLTPLVALDHQSAKMNEFVVFDPILGGMNLIEPDNLSSTNIRIGLLVEVGRLRTRLQYMRQIAGEDFATSQSTLFWNDLAASTPVRSTQWGKDWLNVGVGYEIVSTRHWRMFADYNFDWGKNTTSHLGSLNTIFRW